jgi:hypothetical protein
MRSRFKPLLPAFALAVGLLWDRFFDKDGEKEVSGLVRTACYLLLVSLIGACILLPWFSQFFKSEHRNFNFLAPALFLIRGGIAGLVMCVQKKTALTLAMLMIILSGGFLYAVQCVFPALNQYNSMKPFSMQVKSLVSSDDLLVSFCQENASFMFYSGIQEIKEIQTPTELTTVIMNSPQRVFCLIYKKDFDKIVAVIPFRMFRWHEGKADDHEMLLISNHERS